MPAATLECPSCKKAVTIDAFLSSCSDFCSAVNVVRFTCPLCRGSTDARIERGRISLGYVYAAGAPSFCGMVDVTVEGLSAWQEGAELAAEFGGKVWKIRPKSDS
jgi:hypothetical protein